MNSHKPRIALVLLPVCHPFAVPVGLGFLQACLVANGFEAEILDMNRAIYTLHRETWDRRMVQATDKRFNEAFFDQLQQAAGEWVNRLFSRLSHFDVIGFSCYQSNLPTTLRVIEKIRSKSRGQKIILGGPEMSALSWRTHGALSAGLPGLVDHIVIGEGEKVLLSLVRGEPNPHIIRASQDTDLATLPFPRYYGLSFSDYSKAQVLPVQFSRGCVRACSFCAERLLVGGYRTRPVAHVIEEITYHSGRTKISKIVFHDSILNGKPEKLISLCDSLAAFSPVLPWEAQIAIMPDMPQCALEKMRASGCCHLFIGLESGCDRTLRRMRKGYTAPEALAFLRRLREAGLSFGVSLITGFPGETDEDFDESQAFLLNHRELILKIEQLNRFVYYDGTDPKLKAPEPTEACRRDRLDRMQRELKAAGYKMTPAFIDNLVDP